MSSSVFKLTNEFLGGTGTGCETELLISIFQNLAGDRHFAPPIRVERGIFPARFRNNPLGVEQFGKREQM